MSDGMRVLFLIKDFTCHPSQLTDSLGIEPTRTWVAGEVNPRTRTVYHSNGWMLESPLGEQHDLDPHVGWLLSRLPSDLDRLRELIGVFSAKLYCAIYTSGDRPTLFLDSRTLGRLSQLTASLDLDLYVMPSEDRPSDEA